VQEKLSPDVVWQAHQYHPKESVSGQSRISIGSLSGQYRVNRALLFISQAFVRIPKHLLKILDLVIHHADTLFFQTVLHGFPVGKMVFA